MIWAEQNRVVGTANAGPPIGICAGDGLKCGRQKGRRKSWRRAGLPAKVTVGVR